MDISCHCGALRQTVRPRLPTAGLQLCHCDQCRRASGVLCTAYIPVSEPPGLDGTRSYDIAGSAGAATLYFCGTCGCQAFRAYTSEDVGQDGPSSRRLEWEVASGIFEGPSSTESKAFDHPGLRFAGHVNVQDTKDGGLSIWLCDIDNTSTAKDGKSCPSRGDTSSEKPRAQQAADTTTLAASCLCGGVRLLISRPDDTSRLPVSNYPDLTHAYASTNLETVRNPRDEKWWLRQHDTKYLAGTCACRSCRLTTGFEIQTWAFIPRSNISVYLPTEMSHMDRHGQDEIAAHPLDFERVHAAGVLQGYDSSAGVQREFCPSCGATVFWHDRWRPELIDVSVGLLRDEDGARVEGWLDWWRGRVSFAEETGTSRTGAAARWAMDLVSRLEDGMRSSG